MKIFYCILAHKDPTHIKRLVDSLITKDTNFLIHIDKKSDIAPFKAMFNENTGGGLNYSNQVRFLEERIDVRWSSYKHLKTILKFMEAVIKGKNIKDGDRFFVLSGQDYPLYSNEKIIKTLEEAPKKQYLAAYNITKGDSAQQKTKVSRYWFFDHSKWVRRFLNYFFFFVPHRKKTQVFFNGRYNDIYFGSDWFSLTVDAVKYILKTAADADTLKYFKHAYCPSELFFHTILFNSPEYKNSLGGIHNHFQDTPRAMHFVLAVLHQIENGHKGEVKVLDENDFDTLINSNKMFCRKVETEKSANLLDLIDKHRKGAMLRVSTAIS